MKTSGRILVVVLSVFLVSSTSLFASYNYEWKAKHFDSEEREVKSFNEIDVSGAFNIQLIQGDSEKVVVMGDADNFELVKTEVIGRRLKIYYKSHFRNNSETYTVKVFFKNLQRVQASGAVDLNAVEELNFDEFKMRCSGAVNINLELDVDKLRLDLSGASNVELEGVTDFARIDVSGASNFDGLEFKIGTCILDVGGASDVDVYVKDKLDADVSGASDLTYYGNPDDVSIDESGISHVRKVDK